MQRILDVLNEQAANGDDHLQLSWEISLSDIRLRVKAATRSVLGTQEEAWLAATELRRALIAASGQAANTSETVSVVAVPVGHPHDEVDPLAGYRGQVSLIFPSSVAGEVRAAAD